MIRRSISAMIVQVDLFSASGELPANLDQVLERAKDIQYSSKTRFNTNRVKELEGMRVALGRLLEEVAAEIARRSGLQAAQRRWPSTSATITIMHLINRRLDTASSAKDYEFSRATVREHWEAGLDDVRRTCSHPDWLNATEIVDGVRAFDLAV